MKLMIIDDGIFGATIALILTQSIDVDVIMSSHEDALETFLFADPTHVLVCESWGETADGKTAEFGEVTFKNISNSAGVEVIIKTAGFESHNNIVYPPTIEDIQNLFK